MISSAEALTAFETCERRGLWTRQWESHRKHPTEVVRRSVTAALTTPSKDPGEYAGEEVMTLAADKGLDLASGSLYDCALNHAAIADIVTTAILQTPTQHQLMNGRVDGWQSSAMVSGNYLRRFTAVSSWGKERQAHESRSWYALGEVCRLNMPMQMIVAVLGPLNGARRHGYWSRALLHPTHSSVRFRKRSRATIEGFKETWIPIFREEHDEIERRTWLQGMLEDGVLRDTLIVVDIPVPGELERNRIVDLGKRKMEALNRISWGSELPGKQLSTCDGPLAPCPFRGCCWAQEETKPGPLTGFDELE